jgi:hypothetical protein
LHNSFPPKKSYKSYYTLGILVDPPTKTTSIIDFFSIPESFNTFSTGGIHYLKYYKHNSSNLALDILMLKSSDSANESTSIEVSVEADKILLALSHYVLNLLKALGFLETSTFVFLKNSLTQ